MTENKFNWDKIYFLHYSHSKNLELPINFIKFFISNDGMMTLYDMNNKRIDANLSDKKLIKYCSMQPLFKPYVEGDMQNVYKCNLSKCFEDSDKISKINADFDFSRYFLLSEMQGKTYDKNILQQVEDLHNNLKIDLYLEKSDKQRQSLQ